MRESDVLIEVSGLVIAIGLANCHLVEVERVEHSLLQVIRTLDNCPCFKYARTVRRNVVLKVLFLVVLCIELDPALECGLVSVSLVEVHR